MRKRIEQYSEEERKVLADLAVRVNQIWESGCHRIVVGDTSQPEALVCWQEKDDWVRDIGELAERGKGKIPSFPRKRIYKCKACFYRFIADIIK